MAQVHSTAVVDKDAEIAADVQIGPFCVIGPHVVLGDAVCVASHVHISGHTMIGARTRISPFASLGGPPQSVRYRGGPTRLVIGPDCDIRENVTMNTGTEDGGGLTEVGARCLFLAGSHVGHDCHVGSDVILANNAVLGGHVTTGDYVSLGGHAAVHQFVRIGESAMISGVSGVAGDVIPFALAIGQRAVLKGLNVVGLKRRGYGRSDIQRLRGAYRELFIGGGVFRDRLSAVERKFADDPLVGKVIAFVRETGSRPLLMPFNSTVAAGADSVS